MADNRIDVLNERFGSNTGIRFTEGKGGLPKAIMERNGASVDVYLQGAQITSYRPTADIEALWMSDSAVYRPGKALRGGIPLCWPWFGANMETPDRPQHGYARNSDFDVRCSDSDSCSVVFELDPASVPYPEWRNRLRLEFELRLAGSLWMEMRSYNVGEEALTIGNALHSYFAISDRAAIAIPELTGLDYRDKLQDFRERRQDDPIVLDGEVDRVYGDIPGTVQLLDGNRQRNTRIRSWGNNNLVVWNPGKAKAAAMADFDDDGYRHMVCIEPANALRQRVTLQPGASHALGQCISIREID